MIKKDKHKIEILDTTLRDGEQTQGVSFTPREKLHIAKILLRSLNVDRIEVASAGVSHGEFEAVRHITRWASENDLLSRIEILGFVDDNKSLEWIKNAGGYIINLLCKGSLLHLEKQLKKHPEQHLLDIKKVIDRAISNNIKVNIYLEDWSRGMIHSEEYVRYIIDNLKDEPIERIMLCDTLGILTYEQSYTFCKQLLDNYPTTRFDIHLHNDYDLAVANAYAAVKAGIMGVHTTVNGLGERAGNVPLASVIGVLHDQLKVKTNVNETAITKVSRLVETFSGIRIPANKPIVGANAFIQTSGVHADGDQKANLYCSRLIPERFGRRREYALGKQSGRASIRKNLEELDFPLSEEDIDKLTQKITELGDKKESVTAADLPYIIADMLGSDAIEYKVRITHYALSLSDGLKPLANVELEIEGEKYQEISKGDGQYNAFFKAIRLIYKKLGRELPILTDYKVSIPPGGKTDALVETIISWNYNGRDFRTRGLDADQTEAAIKATEKMLNIVPLSS